MKYTLTRQAEEDLIQIYLYGLKVFGPLQAEKYHGSLEKTFYRIAENPEMYPMASHIRKGYRYCVWILLGILRKPASPFSNFFSK